MNNLSINVFTWDDDSDELIPCHHGVEAEGYKSVDLLLFIKGEDRHYMLIKNFGALMRFVKLLSLVTNCIL